MTKRKRAPGGGRKCIADEPMTKCTIRLPADLLARLRQEPGSLSAAIRRRLETSPPPPPQFD